MHIILYGRHFSSYLMMCSARLINIPNIAFIIILFTLGVCKSQLIYIFLLFFIYSCHYYLLLPIVLNLFNKLISIYLSICLFIHNYIILLIHIIIRPILLIFEQYPNDMSDHLANLVIYIYLYL